MYVYIYIVFWQTFYVIIHTTSLFYVENWLLFSHSSYNVYVICLLIALTVWLCNMYLTESDQWHNPSILAFVFFMSFGIWRCSRSIDFTWSHMTLSALVNTVAIKHICVHLHLHQYHNYTTVNHIIIVTYYNIILLTRVDTLQCNVSNIEWSQHEL